MISCHEYFEKFLLALLVMVLSACSSLAPYQQVRYSSGPQLVTMKKGMSREEAVGILKMYVKDGENTQYSISAVGGVVTTISEKSVMINTIVNDEYISFDTTNRMDISSKGAATKDTVSAEGRPAQSAFVMKYKNVTKIKMYTYKELIGSYYKVYLYGKLNKPIFIFRQSFKDNGEEKTYRLLAALSILMPNAQEEYNERDTQSYMDPQFK